MLTKKQLSGKEPVVVKNTTASGKVILESDNAYIIEVYYGDKHGVFALVNIDGDHIDRWVLGDEQSDQKQI